MCDDAAVNMLKSFGFQTMRLPRADFGPLQVISRRGSTANWIGPLHEVFLDEAQGWRSLIRTDEPRPQISGHASNQFELSLGIKILEGLLKAFSFAVPSASAAFESQSRIEFEFREVLCDYVAPSGLLRYVRSTPIDATDPMIEYMDGPREAVVTFATLKSRGFKVNSYKKNGASAKIDVDLFKGALGVNAGVSVKKEAENSIQFEGQVPMHFGYQAGFIRHKRGPGGGTFMLDLVHADSFPFAAARSVGPASEALPEDVFTVNEPEDRPVRLRDLRDMIKRDRE